MILFFVLFVVSVFVVIGVFEVVENLFKKVFFKNQTQKYSNIKMISFYR